MITREKNDRQVRAQLTRFEVREENEQLHISGYFSVFGDTYEIGPGMTESVDRHAFDNTLGGDIRALTNHDTTLVLGRTSARTLELSIDSHGLYGRVKVNRADQDALNCYERVKRGDVNQCSFGFDILEEKSENLPDGRVRWTLLRVKLYEVSVCTFPAYEDTAVVARARDYEALRARELESWRARMMSVLKRETPPWLIPGTLTAQMLTLGYCDPIKKEETTC